MKKQHGTFTLETITPETAEMYLATMKENRPIRQTWVKDLARMITNGHWEITHQGVAFNCDGSLKDGQHRLSAIIEAGHPVECWVFRGLPKSAMLVIDSGKGRSDSDAMRISGCDITRDEMIVGKRMHEGMSLWKGNWDRRELVSEIMFLRPAIKFVVGLMPGGKKGVCHASVRAVIGRAWYTQDQSRLEEFCQVLLTGITQNDEDNAAIKLRDSVRESAGHGSANRLAVYKKTEAALKAFLQYRKIAKLNASKEEYFELPNRPQD